MKKKTYKTMIEFVIFLLGILIVWQGIYAFGVYVFHIWKSYAMPSPIGVWQTLLHMIGNGTLFNALFHSVLRGIVGYLCAILLGGVLGLCMNRISFLERNVRPLVMGIQTLPSVCWVPFSILWFGLSEQSILFVVVMGSAFSMSIAFDHAIANVPQLYINAAKTMGANNRQLFFRVIVPASLPEVVSGLKQGWSFAWRALMSGEVMTTCVGLGQTLILGRNLADINQVMLVMLVIIGVGIIIDKFVFVPIENGLKANRETANSK